MCLQTGTYKTQNQKPPFSVRCPYYRQLYQMVKKETQNCLQYQYQFSTIKRTVNIVFKLTPIIEEIPATNVIKVSIP